MALLSWFRRLSLSLIPIVLVVIYLIRRRRIKSSREMTINTQALLWNPSLDLQNPTFGFKESAIPFVKRLLADGWKLYLISIVKSDQQQASIEALLEDSGLYKRGLQRQRVLFCSTSEGLVSICRHIRSGIHLDTSVEHSRELAPFIPKCVLLRPRMNQSTEVQPRNVERVNTLTNIVL